MERIFTLILDFIFPPSPESEKLRVLSPAEAARSFPKPEPVPFSFITSLFSYKDPLVKELVLSIKNRRNKHTLLCASYALYKNIPPNSLLIPIPITRKRKNERGYNQCELLIDEILKLDDSHTLEKNFNLLLRTKDRGEQKTKNREERLRSTSDIFIVNFQQTDRPIVIIDDVCTTGSTLNEARDALLKAGYENVHALTLAH